ncbi:MAG: hypothetical protein IKB34_08470 [Clostridia bacterium]|nr:hypothetical protein [Clostridia bacterium]
MSVPIPTHLIELAVDPEPKGDALGFDLQCQCGGHAFTAYRGIIEPTPQEKEETKAFEDFVRRCGARHFSFTVRDDGVTVAIRRNIFGKTVDWAIAPASESPEIYRVKCAKCLKKHLLLDTRIHGYSALSDDTVATTNLCPDSDEQSVERKPSEGAFVFKELSAHAAPYPITVVIRSFATLEECRERGIDGATEEQYANAFLEMIAIAPKTPVSKQITLFDVETC